MSNVHVIQFGKYKGRPITKMEVKELVDYVLFLQDSAVKAGTNLHGPALELVKNTMDMWKRAWDAMNTLPGQDAPAMPLKAASGEVPF